MNYLVVLALLMLPNNTLPSVLGNLSLVKIFYSECSDKSYVAVYMTWHAFGCAAATACVSLWHVSFVLPCYLHSAL
jgi:hypothetical protein